MQKQQSNKEQPADQEVHFYFTDQQLASRRLANSKSFEEILLEKIDSDEHIAEVYSCLNEKIESYKALSLSSQSERPEEINRFLEIKARLFYRFYRTEAKWLEVKDRLDMFDVEKLYELLVDIHRIRDQTKASIYKLFGEKKRKVKINGYLLIANIESLIKELSNAAFPYQLYSHTKETIQFHKEVIVLTDFQAKLMENELMQVKKWEVEWLNPLKSSFLELSDQLQTLKVQLKKEEHSPELQSQPSSIQSNYEIRFVEKIIQIYSLEYIMLHHEVVSHHSSYAHQKIGEGFYPLTKFIQKSPLYQKSTEKITQIVSQNRHFLKNYTDHHYFLKQIAEKMQQIFMKQGKCNILLECSEKMITLLQKWISFCKYSQNSLLLFEVYISVLRIHIQLDKYFLAKRENIISTLFNLYMDKLICYYVDEHWIVMNRVVSFDQEFTSSLLTTNKIIQTLIQFQDKFIALIEQFAPFIQTFIQISKISQNLQEKWPFIESIINKIHYVSLKDQGRFNTSAQSIILQKNSAFTNIDIILSIDHESVDQIKPYLREIKHILMLVTILKRANIKHNINKMQQEQYLTLKKCASYFSREREACVIYELKSKILLFVTLFKMGYHNPTIREDHNSVNLRNRIINLFNRLYSRNNFSSVMISRINSISMRRSHSQESYYIYDPLESISERTTTAVLSQDQAIQLQASEELSTKINKFIITNFVQGENNSKLYLTNLLNILEHQLFISEKDISQENQNLLSKDYTSHLKVCMDLDGVVNPNIQTILEIQRLFYLEEHQRAWNILTKEKKNNAQFNIFLSQLESSSSNSIELLKFMKLFNICEKMNHIFYSDLDSQKNINELVEMINANSLFTIARGPIETIYHIKLAENRLLQLEQFYQGKLNDSRSSTLEYEEVETAISKEYPGIKVYKLHKPNKIIIKIEINQALGNHFQRIHDQFKKYMLFNQIGIYKINDIKVARTITIEIQSNPYIVEDKSNKFQSKILTFSQEMQEKFCRKMLQIIVQTLYIFYEDTRNSLESEQIDLTLQPLSFCINPFYGLILKIIQPILEKKASNSQPIQVKNRKVIESLINPFLSHLSPVFIQHIYYFLQTLSTPTSKKKDWSFNKLLQLPLFMTLQEKQVFLVYFDNKMSEMCDSFHEELRKLRKEKKYRQIDQLRTAKMKDPIYRNYSYNFIVGGVLESQMIFLSICSQQDIKRLDWITEHKKLMISYDLPKVQDSQQIKEYAYSLNYFLKYLRGALAHKIENNYHIISNISQEFPKIFDYLHRRKTVLEMTFEKVMNAKNDWIRYFNADGREADKIKAIFAKKGKAETTMNQDVKQTISHLKKLQEKYIAIKTTLSAQTYACEKCNQFINIVKKSALLLDLLNNLHLNILKKNHFLSVQHNFKQCFLNETLKAHRVLQVFGATRRVEPKHHLVMCWWFYLETELPCLTSCIDKLRWILEEETK